MAANPLISFRISDALRRRLEFCAAECGVSVSQYLRSISETAAKTYLKSAGDGQSAPDSAMEGR